MSNQAIGVIVVAAGAVGAAFIIDRLRKRRGVEGDSGRPGPHDGQDAGARVSFGGTGKWR